MNDNSVAILMEFKLKGSDALKTVYCRNYSIITAYQFEFSRLRLLHVLSVINILTFWSSSVANWTLQINIIRFPTSQLWKTSPHSLAQ